MLMRRMAGSVRQQVWDRLRVGLVIQTGLLGPVCRVGWRCCSGIVSSASRWSKGARTTIGDGSQSTLRFAIGSTRLSHASVERGLIEGRILCQTPVESLSPGVSTDRLVMIWGDFSCVQDARMDARVMEGLQPGGVDPGRWDTWEGSLPPPVDLVIDPLEGPQAQDLVPCP